MSFNIVLHIKQTIGGINALNLLENWFKNNLTQLLQIRLGASKRTVVLNGRLDCRHNVGKLDIRGKDAKLLVNTFLKGQRYVNFLGFVLI